MKRWSLLVVPFLLLLTGCSSSHRPTYTGHQESTEGVPGFVNGKKVAPTVKLGQSYYVDGELHVPRNQPDYVELGMASWYGPGFHGGKTANGEQFDTADLTAAHRTLPLPSIVKVTMVSTGKTVYVRVNDRGPFAHNRIIDLSRAAADKIGLIQAGVGKVRVEYMKAETERFTDLLARGRDPKSIDVASEVLDYTRQQQQQRMVASAQPSETASPAPQESVIAAIDLPPATAEMVAASPFSLAEQTSEIPSREQQPQQMASLSPASGGPAPPTAPGGGGVGYYVQLGAFSRSENAQRAKGQFGAMGAIEIIQKPSSSGASLYHVRMGPYATDSEGQRALASVRASGGADARIIQE